MKAGKKIWLCIIGILLIALGVYCITKPNVTLVSAAYILGLLTLFTGIFKLVFTFKTQAFMPNSGTRMLVALLDIFFGCFLLFNLLGTAISLPMVFAFWVIIESISVFILSFDYKKVGFPFWWALMILGIAGAVLGFFALKNLDVTAVTLSALIGISIILVGLAHIFAMIGVTRFEKKIGSIFKG